MKDTLVLDPNLDRDDFQDQYLNFVRQFLRLHKVPVQENAFCNLVNEITKNIWDHAEGRGEISLEFEGKKLSFEIKDYGTGAHDLKLIKRCGSRLVGNRVNYGNGLCNGMIAALAKINKVRNFRIDTQCGFKYTGHIILTH